MYTYVCQKTCIVCNSNKWYIQLWYVYYLIDPSLQYPRIAERKYCCTPEYQYYSIPESHSSVLWEPSISRTMEPPKYEVFIQLFNSTPLWSVILGRMVLELTEATIKGKLISEQKLSILSLKTKPQIKQMYCIKMK